jgi:hypothetical protein
MKLVTVDVQGKLFSSYVIKYHIMRDPTVDEIREYAEANPKVFIFPFATKTVEEVFDYSDLGNGSEVFSHVVQPFYIGNFEDKEAIIKDWVYRTFAFTDDEKQEVK